MDLARLFRVTMASVVVSAFFGPALAQSLETAHAEFVRGNYEAAASAAAAAGTSEGFALAASSLSAHGEYGVDADGKPQVFQQAIDYARQAVEQDGSNPDAHFQLARALGRYAQTLGAIKAVNQGYADDVKNSLDTAIALDSGFWPAHLSLAAWNMEIVTKAGFLGRITFGATAKKAVSHYSKAVELAPGEIVVMFETAHGLRELDAGQYQSNILQLLGRAVQLEPASAYEREIQDRARTLLAELQ